MRRIIINFKKTEYFWEDAKGNAYDISEMSDEYVLNCITFLQRKVTIWQTLPSSKVVTTQLKDMKADIHILLKEMERRQLHDIFISREDGCENFWKS